MEEVVQQQPSSLEFSPTITKLVTALAEFHKNCPVIGKDKENKYFNTQYADLGTILGVVNPLLAAQGLTVMQFPLPDFSLCTQLTHTSGEWVRSTYQLKPAKADPQGIGSAMTYQKRYAVVAILSLAIDDDDDDGQAAQQPAKKGAPVSNPDKLRNQLRTAVQAIGKDTAESLIVESEGKYKLDSGKPLTKLGDLSVINNEDTLNELLKLFTPANATKGGAK
jgi:hypothetical protein